MKILFYTDLHLSDQTPRSRTGDYRDDILLKLEEIVTLANEYEVDYLLNGADTFDQKSPWRVSHRLVYRAIEILEKLNPKIRHLTTVGTHDVPTGRIERWEYQPLGILDRAKVLEVCLTPYMASDIIIHWVPASYDLDKDPFGYEWHGTVDERPIITVAHGMIVPPGGSFFGDFTDADTIVTDARMVLYGHPHVPHGIYKNSGGTIFVGPGSVSRRDASAYNRARQPKVVLIGMGDDGKDGGTPNFKEIELASARLGSEVFEALIQEEADDNEVQERVNHFVASLKDTNIAADVWGLEDILAEVRSADASPEVRRLAEEIIESVS